MAGLGLVILLLLASLAPEPAPPADSMGTAVGRIVVRKPLTKRRIALEYDARDAAAVRHAGPASTASDAEMSRFVIYLDGEGLPTAPPVTADLVQRGRTFEPELVIVPAGSTVSFPNLDPIFHNVFSLSKPKYFDLGYYPEGQTRRIRFDRPGPVQVFCHLHTNMSAAVFVAPSAWYTKPASDGSYELRSIPPGRYQLVVWHKSAGFFRRLVEIAPSETLKVDFEIPLRDGEVLP
jgi:plastocyanin